MTEKQNDYHSKLAFFHNNDSDSDFNTTYAQTAPELTANNNEILSSFGFGPLIETIKKSIIPLQNANLLEIGGSSGLLSEKLQDMGANITLLETQEKFIQKAKERGIKDVRTYNGTNLSNVLLGKEFDAVIANRVFEDIVMPEHQAQFIARQLKSFIKPGGLIIIGTQQPTAVWEEAIIKGSDSKLIKSHKFSDAGYIRQINIYQKS
jgi:2-polyprenyl-3-methyl-5-hydroxy-6-metoxy-1,4-benzoquinol methylase